jgi:hypothetical protein
MLKVGIHEDLVLSKAAVNDKGTLGLQFRPKSLDGVKKADVSVFQEEEGVEVSASDGDSSLLLFPFKVTTLKKKDTGDEYSDEEKGTMVNNDMKKFKDQLSCILGAYRTTKDIKWKPYEGTGINKDNYHVELLDNENLFKVYTNYVNQFLGWIAPFLNDDQFAVRLKLIRQSKDKHFATIPGRFLDTNPFIEPMEVPKDKSQLKYSKWEKDNGFDNGDAVSKDDGADAIPETTPDASASVFGQR